MSNTDLAGMGKAGAEARALYRPAFWAALKNYSVTQFKADAMAGINVGFVALPLSMALAVAAGAPPQTGLYSSIIGGIAVAFFGGSRVQISGPTAAFVVILAPLLAQYGLHGVMVTGLLAGMMLIVMGLIRFGALIKYIPHPVTAGYNTGIAVLIATQQIKEFFGVRISYDAVKTVSASILHNGQRGTFLQTVTERVERLPDDYASKWPVLYQGTLATPGITLLHSALVGITGVLVLVYFPKWLPNVSRRLPAPLVSILSATAMSALLALLFNAHAVQTLGAFPSALPLFDLAPLRTFPLNAATLATFLMPALSLAILCAIASLLSAVVADGMTNTKHDSNTELIGQGIGNILAPLFGGIAVSGAIARTVVNARNGARTPIAAIVHSLTLLALIFVAAPCAQFIPKPALAAILLVVAYNMADFKTLTYIFSAPISDILVLMACLLLTVFVNMSTAISVGMILAALLFMRRMAELSSVESQLHASDAELAMHDIDLQDIPRRVTIYSVDGPFFFAATEKAFQAMKDLGDNTRVVILRLNRVPAMDISALIALTKFKQHLKSRGITLVISGARAQPTEVMKRAGFLDRVGMENVKTNIEWALVRCYEILGPEAVDRRTGNTAILPKAK